MDTMAAFHLTPATLMESFHPCFSPKVKQRQITLANVAGVRWNAASIYLSIYLSVSLFLDVQARWSNSKNLEDDPIRRQDQHERYDQAEKSYLASVIAGMGLGTRVFLPSSFRGCRMA